MFKIPENIATIYKISLCVFQYQYFVDILLKLGYIHEK